MKNKILLIALITVIILFQTGILVYVITNSFTILDDSRMIKLKTNLHDPFDIMKGRYIQLNFSQEFESIYFDKCPSLQDLSQDQILLRRHSLIYGIFELDENGYGTLKNASFNKPEPDQLFIAFRINKIETDHLTVRIHFDKYYMQEQLAIKADSLISDLQNRNPTLILKTDKNGKTVQQGFEVDGVEIETFLKSNLL